MHKFAKIAAVVLILVAVGFFLRDKIFPGKNTDQDLEAMKTSITTDPKVNNPNLTPDQIESFMKRFRTAREQVISLNFDILQGINEVAIIKQSLGDFEGAKTAWEYANIIRPKNSLSFSNLAALYHFDLKEYDKAEQNYLISIANQPNDIPTIRNFYELYFYALKDNAKAEALLLESIKANPGVADLYSLAGSFYASIGRKDEAIKNYEKHLELNPGNEAVKRELEKLKSAS